jgi:hypothetical protein
MSELKACPFCGAEARFFGGPMYGIECASAFCGVAIKAQHKTREAAAVIWNHRIYSGNDDALPRLTERQEEYLEFIQDQISKFHVPPTRQEIADHFVTSINAANEMVNRLEKKARIRIVRESSRGIRLVDL